LSQEQRQSITLAYYQGMSHSDIADWLQQPVGSVKAGSAARWIIFGSAWAYE
jgi:DNA-directed RNA polymerase specialized sigma24 family protein